MKSDVPWWKWIAALLVGFIGWELSEVGASLLSTTFFGQDEILTGLRLGYFGIIKAVLAIGFIAVALMIVNRRVSDIGIGSKNLRRDLMIGTLVAIGMACLEFVSIALTGGAQRSDVVAVLQLLGQQTIFDVTGILILSIVLGGIAEELFYHGHIIYTLKNSFKDADWLPWLALFLSAIYFGWRHSYQGTAGVIDAIVMSLIWGYLYIRTGRITASIVAHGLYNTIIVIGLVVLF